MGRLLAEMASAWARRGLCALVIVALMCLATSEATSVEEADLSAKGTNPFGGEMGKIKKAAKAKAHGMLKKGGVSGIVPTSRLVKGWLAKADSKYSRKAKRSSIGCRRLSSRWPPK